MFDRCSVPRGVILAWIELLSVWENFAGLKSFRDSQFSTSNRLTFSSPSVDNNTIRFSSPNSRKESSPEISRNIFTAIISSRLFSQFLGWRMWDIFLLKFKFFFVLHRFECDWMTVQYLMVNLTSYWIYHSDQLSLRFWRRSFLRLNTWNKE